MDLRPGLALSGRPQLILTPRMQQALRVLQAPQEELALLLREELEQNPFLDEEPEEAGSGEPPDPPGRGDTEGEEGEAPPAPGDGPLPGIAAGRGAWEDGDRIGRVPDRSERWSESLLRQLRLQGRGPGELRIAEHLLGCLDARGFLGVTTEQAAEDLGLPVERVEAVRRALLRLDPPGAAALGLGECLRVQLELAGEGGSLAARVLECDLRLLAARRDAELARRLGVEVGALREAIGRLRRLRPNPAGDGRGEAAPPVYPDLRVERIDGRWEVFAVDRLLPRLRLAPAPALGPRASAEERIFVAERLARARWLLGSLGARQRTLARLMRGILEEQGEFFQRGVEALKPMGYRRMAGWMGLHESTIARAVRGKFVETPRGVFPLRFFFGHGLPTRDGARRSAAAVAHRIRALVRGEPPLAPLSDEEIARRLRREGLCLARRTVAKYRERMGVPKAAYRQRG